MRAKRDASAVCCQSSLLAGVVNVSGIRVRSNFPGYYKHLVFIHHPPQNTVHNYADTIQNMMRPIHLAANHIISID